MWYLSFPVIIQVNNIVIFGPNDVLVIISLYIYPILSKNVYWPYLKNSLHISLVRQIGFPIHFISVAHSCPVVFIEDITPIWQDVRHIWKYYIKKCNKMLVIFTYNDRNWAIFLRKWQNTVIHPIGNMWYQDSL